MPPLVDAQEVARGIVRCARSPKREVTYKRVGRALELLHSLAPGLYGRILPATFEAGNYGRASAAATAGQVFEPMPGQRSIEGGWRRDRRRELVRAFADALRGALRGVRGER